jgi:hypothetical protein
VATHALVTGPIQGRIPVDGHPEGWVDVTPDMIFFEHDDENEAPPQLLAVAEAIENEHYRRGSHPLQLAERALQDPGQYDPEGDQPAREEHARQLADLHKRMGLRGVTR